LPPDRAVVGTSMSGRASQADDIKDFIRDRARRSHFRSARRVTGRAGPASSIRAARSACAAMVPGRRQRPAGGRDPQRRAVCWPLPALDVGRFWIGCREMSLTERSPPFAIGLGETA
jgi:hypothetical protein